MSLIQLYIASEIARDAAGVLGELGLVHFRDVSITFKRSADNHTNRSQLNSQISNFQRSFIKEIRNLDNVERQLRYLQSVIIKHRSVELVESSAILYQPAGASPTSSEIESMISDVQMAESRIQSLDSNFENFNSKISKFIENRDVLLACSDFFDHNDLSNLENRRNTTQGALNDLRNSFDEADELLVQQQSLESGLGPILLDDSQFGRQSFPSFLPSMSLIAGSINRDKYILLEQILWRTLRGNLFITHIPLPNTYFNEKTKKEELKDAFIVFTHGDRLLSKSKRIVESLDGSVYQVDSDHEIAQQNLDSLNIRIADLEEVIKNTNTALNVELSAIATKMEDWKLTTKKEKLIYVTLNKFNYDQTRHGLIAEGWIPKVDLPTVKNSLRDITERSGTDISSVVNELNTNRTPPTFHRTNKFTAAFQAICDAYGICTYQEVNPGLPSIITFPFMFAIMFGDVGHGFIVALAALYLILREHQISLMKRDEIFDMVYSGRYMIFLMGVFSIYTGLLYNDVFSRSLTLFKSGWTWPENFQLNESIEATSTGGVYAFGLDYNWHGTENNLLFTNSYKMKLSILMGFIHMTYSFMFSLANYRFFKSRVDIIGNFIPGLLFMQSIFGYLSITIVYKWCVDWIGSERQPPGLLNMLINMFLSPGHVDEKLYAGQSFVQVMLVIIALVCVPWLLLYKPLTLRRQNNSSVALGYKDLAHEEQVARLSDVHESHLGDDHFQIEDFAEDEAGEPFEFGEVMIHQVIHTIEFCLNCVSHTASYLRLWALSLAHNQLSSVLWSMTISNAFGMTGAFGVFMTVVLFGMWFVLTLCILVMMEGTSAMLHSLRLHWVESMSKFFEGEGYLYEPFSFKTIIEQAEEEQ